MSNLQTHYHLILINTLQIPWRGNSQRKQRACLRLGRGQPTLKYREGVGLRYRSRKVIPVWNSAKHRAVPKRCDLSLALGHWRFSWLFGSWAGLVAHWMFIEFGGTVNGLWRILKRRIMHWFCQWSARSAQPRSLRGRSSDNDKSIFTAVPLGGFPLNLLELGYVTLESRVPDGSTVLKLWTN